MTTKICFNNAARSQFLPTLRKRVDQHFSNPDISRHANPAMWFKTVFFLSLLFGLYTTILFSGLPAWPLLLLAVMLGVCSAFVGFNVCHDAIHGSFSKNNSVNKVLSSVFYLLGANPYIWNLTHNIVHHTYTNIPGHDEDIEVAPGLIRISDEEPVNRIQRYQHWYAFHLYSLASLSWLFRKDFKKFFQQRIGNRVNNHPRIEYFNLFFYKFLYLVLFVALPLLLLLDLAWWQVLIGFLALHLAQGLTMGLVFQLAHVVEGTDFPVPDKGGNLEDAWAEHQMHTTANFATDSRTAAFFLGGLNRQIEHHLFPKVCHIHYGKIGKIVKQTALEFDIPYIESPTFLSALRSHYRMLRRFGKEAA